MKTLNSLAFLAVGVATARQQQAAPVQCKAKCGSQIGFVRPGAEDIFIDLAPDGTLTVPQQCRAEQCNSIETDLAATKATLAASLADIDAMGAALAAQTTENKALHALISHLAAQNVAVTARLAALEGTHASSHTALDNEMDTLESAYKRADSNLQQAISMISLTPGAKGDQGIRGIQGTQGDKGDTGADGKDGKDGKDGVNPTPPPTPAVSWKLAANINPSDGHNFGWGYSGWSKGNNLGSVSQALNADFLSSDVWNGFGASYIAIVRHNNGRCEAAKVWELKNDADWLGGSEATSRRQYKTMQQQFELKGANPGRKIGTTGKHVSSDIRWGLSHKDEDPIFAKDGRLAFNWWYSNNGARIALDTTYAHGGMPGTGTNDDDLHGLGNEFGADTKTGGGSPSWRHDVSVHQGNCHGTSCRVQGTDHGTSLRDGTVFGSYAIYVTNKPAEFKCVDRQLTLKQVDGWWVDANGERS